jgi:polysaccharide biosynthesis transport protein
MPPRLPTMSSSPTPLPSTSLTPAGANNTDLAPAQQWGPPLAGGGDNYDDGAEQPTNWHRYLAALGRYKWLIAIITILGTVGGVVATRLIAPEYESHATLWIAPDEMTHSMNGGGGNGELLPTTAWTDLFKSLRVTQAVVIKRKLYLHYAGTDDRPFTDFATADAFQPGAYELLVDARGASYTLQREKGAVLERGAVGDSIGRAIGFRWQPPAAVLPPNRKLHFGLVSVSNAADALVGRAITVLPDQSNFLRVTLTSASPTEAASTLNEWLAQFITQAVELKRRKIVEVTATIADQMQLAANRLKTAEDQLHAYETRNFNSLSEIAPPRPSIQGTTVDQNQLGIAGGGTFPSVADPTVTSYLQIKFQHEALSRDIAEATEILNGIRLGTATPDALLAVPSLMLGADNLRAAIAEHNTKETALRDLQRTYTDEYKGVVDAKAQLAALDNQTIPQLANLALERLRATDSQLNKQLGTSHNEAASIPDRMIEQLRLQREYQSASEIYQELQKSYEQSHLAEASAIPDVTILDHAEPPAGPSRNTAPRILLMAVLGSLGFGLALAILLDRIDVRFRYPEQATDELGLQVIGTVPGLPSARQRARDPEAAAQVVEAFRTIRLHLTHMYDPRRPMTLTVSSPGAGEGKSLISSNLAMSFAESGRRTLLIDGDIRRGQLHSTFNLKQAPGLLDYLLGHTALDEVLQQTDFQGLTVVTCGTRRHRGPELLQSEVMAQFIASVKPHFDTIIVDSPPLGAGIDPFALAHVTQNLLMVLRVGTSDRKMASAKLAAMDRLAGVRQLGAVLNDVATTGVFRYYSYLYGYKLDEGELRAQIPSQVGELSAD